MKMKFKYISLYQIRGLTHNPTDGDIQLYSKENDTISLKAVLTEKLDEYCYDIDRALSLGNFMLRGMNRQRDENAQIEEDIENIRENRKKRIQGSETLMFIGEGETETDFNQELKETDDYILGFDILKKEDIVSLFKDDINSTLAAFCLASERVPLQIKHMGGGIFLINEQAKPIYSFSLTGSGEAYSSMPTTAELIKEAQGQIKAISKREVKVYRLLAKAISRDNDDLRRFMFGWAGLETLIKIIFSEYEKVFVQNLLAADPSSQAGIYFKRIREVMKGKYNIVDQFVVVASCIASSSAEMDIKEFSRIKKIRDRFFHDTSVAENVLPTVAAVELLKKYLRLHMKYKKSLTKKSSGR
jgi:hypothetical protein